MKRLLSTLAVAAAGLLSTHAIAASTTVVGFDGGSDGGFTGNALFEATDGNPGGAARHVTDLFFNDLRTGGRGEPANTAFLGDYSSFTNIEFSVDVKTNMLNNSFGVPTTRAVGVMLIDRDVLGPNGPSGVFYEVGTLGVSATPDWTTLSVTIADPTSTTLPSGWVGFGDEDPNTLEPTLPAGASFATILAGVDEFRITGAVPGFLHGHGFWDVQIDNISVVVPEPASGALLTAGVVAAFRRRRA